MTERDANYFRNMGRLSAYIELLNTGIREICMPSFGYRRKRDLDYVARGARRSGYYTLLVTYNRIQPDGNKFKSYQRIIYRKHRRADVQILRRTLQKAHKDKNDHKVMGRIFGYSREAIAAFINEKVAP